MASDSTDIHNHLVALQQLSLEIGRPVQRGAMLAPPTVTPQPADDNMDLDEQDEGHYNQMDAAGEDEAEVQDALNTAQPMAQSTVPPILQWERGPDQRWFKMMKLSWQG